MGRTIRKVLQEVKRFFLGCFVVLFLVGVFLYVVLERTFRKD
jgi:predicted PurR-regulated permease PerM